MGLWSQDLVTETGRSFLGTGGSAKPPLDEADRLWGTARGELTRLGT
jgi:hypothetical protein